VEEGEENRVKRLPPGPHGIPPELVERNQRERLIAAMAEVCAERGYAECSVAEVSKRAGVSTASFYRQFKDKRECMLGSFDDLFGRLLEQIERACAEEKEPQAKAGAGIRTAAALLAADLPTARLLSIEVLAVGTDGVRLQHRAIEHLASLLRDPAVGLPLPPDRQWAAVAAVVALVGRRVAEGDRVDVAELEALAFLL
jgi:AcrR family transcriptional regulator